MAKKTTPEEIDDFDFFLQTVKDIRNNKFDGKSGTGKSFSAEEIERYNRIAKSPAYKDIIPEFQETVDFSGKGSSIPYYPSDFQFNDAEFERRSNQIAQERLKAKEKLQSQTQNITPDNVNLNTGKLEKYDVSTPEYRQKQRTDDLKIQQLEIKNQAKQKMDNLNNYTLMYGGEIVDNNPEVSPSDLIRQNLSSYGVYDVDDIPKKWKPYKTNQSDFSYNTYKDGKPYTQVANKTYDLDPNNLKSIEGLNENIKILDRDGTPYLLNTANRGSKEYRDSQKILDEFNQNTQYFTDEKGVVRPYYNTLKYGGDLPMYDMGGAILSGAGKGASIGATFGNLIPIPGLGAAIGAGAGAIIGGGIGALKQRNTDKGELAQRREEALTNSEMYNSTEDISNQIKKSDNINQGLAIGEGLLNTAAGVVGGGGGDMLGGMKYGGNLPMYNTGGSLIEYEGATHEQMNNMGTTGIPVNENGVPVDNQQIPIEEAVAEVENDETSYSFSDGEKFVFSEELKLPNNSKKSFADESKKIKKKYENEQDPYQKNALEKEMEFLKQSQEAEKNRLREYYLSQLEKLGPDESMQPDMNMMGQAPQMNYGGPIKDWMQSRNVNKNAYSDREFLTQEDAEGNILNRQGIPVKESWLGKNYSVDFTRDNLDEMSYKTVGDRFRNTFNLSPKSHVTFEAGGNLPKYNLGNPLTQLDISAINQAYVDNELAFNPEMGIEDFMREGLNPVDGTREMKADEIANIKRRQEIEDINRLQEEEDLKRLQSQSGYEPFDVPQNEVSPYGFLASNVGNIHDLAYSAKNLDPNTYQNYDLERVNFDAAKLGVEKQGDRSRSNLRRGMRDMGSAGAYMTGTTIGNANINDRIGQATADINMQEQNANVGIGNQENMMNTQLTNQGKLEDRQDRIRMDSVRSGAIHGMGQNTQGYLKDKSLSKENNSRNQMMRDIMMNPSKYGYKWVKNTETGQMELTK